MSSQEIPQKACPICKKPAEPQYIPFCSERCSMIDLGNWFTEKYTILGEPAEDADESTPEEEPEKDD